VPQQRLVFTSMLGGGWRPQSPWLGFTAAITFAGEGQGCRYTAQVMHPDKTVRDQHEPMGFFDGWNMAIDRLQTLAAGL